MPGVKPKRAVSKSQLRRAYAHKGENWAKEIIQGTHTTKRLPEKKRKGK